MKLPFLYKFDLLKIFVSDIQVVIQSVQTFSIFKGHMGTKMKHTVTFYLRDYLQSFFF